MPTVAPDPSTLFRLDGRVAIVTGASSGLGDRFARVLDAAGASVVVAARREDRLASLCEDLTDGLAVACDVTSDDDVAGLVAATVERFGHVDVVVNNAGISEVAPALEETPDDFRRSLDVNLTGVFTLSREAVRVMVDQGRPGVVVNVASILGLVGVGDIPLAGYVAAKGGVVNLTRELAAQWAEHGIRVNAIAPGWFPSEMTEEMFASERGRAWIARRAPMGRAGREDELDGALLYLASDASSYVTGQTLAVDGGWTAI